MTPARLYAHCGDHLPEASRPYTLNPIEQAREESQSDPLRRDSYRLSRLLWRTGARAFCRAACLPEVAESQLPASGNPCVAGQRFHSSLSHCRGLQVVAFHSGPIGVDAEPMARGVPWQRLAGRWFTSVEQQWLQEGAEPNERFLLLWTLKEAWIKATHRGIASNLQALTLEPAAAGPVLRLDQTASGWRAFTAECNGIRVSVIVHESELPQWCDVPAPGSDDCRLRDCEWREWTLGN